MIAPGAAQGIRTGRTGRAAAEITVRLNVLQRVRQLLYDAAGVAVAIVMLFPIYWMVATAFKPGQDILRLEPKWFPNPITLDNFQDAIARPFFLEDVKNSVVIVGVMLAAALAISFLAAVGTARFGFKGRTAYLVMIIAVQMVPLNALIIPLYLMLDRVTLTDALPGVILVYLAVVLPFMVWTLRGFVANIPVELEESAMIDGCTRFGAFIRITFPLIGPGLVATAIFGFIQAWNEYIVAYVLLSSPENQTLTVWLASFTTNHGPQWGPLMAAATLTGLPVVAFFLILQRYLAGGLTAGAVKG
jgi:N,N'-diacetylchitobiose transport system permease protein